MKKLFLIIIVLFAFVFVSEAQIATLTLRDNSTYVEYSIDVTLTNAVAQYFIINAPKAQYTAQTVTYTLDSLAGDHTAMTVVLAGRASDQTTVWTTLDTSVWTMDNEWASTDTVIIVEINTENHYREFKLTFTGAGTGTSTLGNVEFKQFLGIP